MLNKNLLCLNWFYLFVLFLLFEFRENVNEK